MENTSAYDLIIFDCDGTLADSELAHNAVLLNRLHAMGLTEYTTEIAMEKFMGKAITDIVDMVETEHNVRFPEGHYKDAQALYKSILPDHINLDVTTRPLLEKLRDNGQKMAVGSNGTRTNVIETIKAAGFDEFFPEDRIFTFEDVENAKPAPDLYLHVCDVMHTNPRHAVVVEDTVAGALAGISGKIDTVGYVGLSHREGQAQRLKDIGCKHIISSMDEFTKILYPQAAAA
jgi:HAD superfamily hydrolase (TIGR01509 family)